MEFLISEEQRYPMDIPSVICTVSARLGGYVVRPASLAAEISAGSHSSLFHAFLR